MTLNAGPGIDIQGGGLALRWNLIRPSLGP